MYEYLDKYKFSSGRYHSISYHKKWPGDMSFFSSLRLRLLDFEPWIVNKKLGVQ